jgi:hypothetical protein
MEQIRMRKGFRLVLQEPECTNMCFWYIPPSLQGQEDQPDFNERLHKVCSNLCLTSHLWITDLSGLSRVNYECTSEVRVPIVQEYVYCINGRVMMKMAVTGTYSFNMVWEKWWETGNPCIQNVFIFSEVKTGEGKWKICTETSWSSDWVCQQKSWVVCS